jgi:hypothetical protein
MLELRADGVVYVRPMRNTKTRTGPIVYDTAAILRFGIVHNSCF